MTGHRKFDGRVGYEFDEPTDAGPSYCDAQIGVFLGVA